MRTEFDYFIIFAEMRTGSNFLEANLNALPGVRCFGEAFNPHFIGYPNGKDILNIAQSARDADPLTLIGAIRDAPGLLGGFRYFHDHDPRVLDHVLPDPRCAKIILTRNPVESYVSWKIAQTTGQWKLTNVTRRKEAKATFDGPEFMQFADDMQAFQVQLLNRLQRSGQTAFYIAYEDLQDVEVLNGLAAWLGSDARLEQLDQSLKRQNPSPLMSKVSNPRDMEAALSGVDRFNLSRTPNFEPRRGPAAPSYVLGAETPLLYMPMRGGPVSEVTAWMAALDGVDSDDLTSGANQKTIRQWMKANPAHRRFTVLRHPLARAHSVFCHRILQTGPDSYLKIRETLRRQFDLPIPADAPDETYSVAEHRAAFVAFLEFLRRNLAGQTAIRVDAEWASQATILESFASFALPDLVVREDEMQASLTALAERLGCTTAPKPEAPENDAPFGLSDIHDEELEKLCANVYQRDFVTFGFPDWKRL